MTRPDAALEPFELLPDGALERLEHEAADVACFLGFRPGDMRTSVRL